MIKNTPTGAPATPYFVEELRAELKKAVGDYARISRMTKGRLPYFWIRAFAQGRIKSPSFERLVYLSQVMGKPLFIGKAKRYDQIELVL